MDLHTSHHSHGSTFKEASYPLHAERRENISAAEMEIRRSCLSFPSQTASSAFQVNHAQGWPKGEAVFIRYSVPVLGSRLVSEQASIEFLCFTRFRLSQVAPNLLWQLAE